MIKRRKTMLLCVTATSIGMVIGCEPAGHPVGTVSRPPYAETDAALADPGNAGTDASTVTTAAPDAATPFLLGEVAKPPEHQRVGTTANIPDVSPPTVGTTAHVPDRKK